MALVAMVKGPRRLAAENTALRHQISVLRRKHPGRVRLSRPDRIFLGWLAKICPSVLDAIVVVRPETVLRWHRYGFRALWRCKSPNPGGRPAIDRDLKQLIKSMARDNPLWGAPRIHGELLKLVSLSKTLSADLRDANRPSVDDVFKRDSRKLLIDLKIFCYHVVLLAAKIHSCRGLFCSQAPSV